ncbi:MAG: hypothetical protein KF819_32295 [Labilithrix sp.]|nr:hypothetical protein [Labilithrix sp.]
MRRFAIAIVSALMLLGLSESIARAADVGVVADPRDAFATRLVAELEQLGFSVTREASLTATSREVALVRVSDTDVDLYEVSRDGSLRKRTMISARADPLKAAEEVRALLLPLVERPPEPAPPEPPPAPAPPAPPAGAEAATPPLAPPPERRSVEIALGGAAFFGGAKPGAAASLSASFFPRALRAGRASLGVGAGGLFELAPESVSASQGSADVRAILFGPELIGRLDLSPEVRADLALGAFASHLVVTGNANAPFTSRDDSAWTWSPTGRARLAYALGATSIFAEGRLGVASPGVAIRFDGGTVREWGTPWGAAGAGVAIAF